MMKYRCSVKGCGGQVSPTLAMLRPFCEEHWQKIPLEQRNDIMQARHKGVLVQNQEVTKAATYLATKE